MSHPTVDENSLAIQRTDLAARRTLLAHERTLTAWIRTGLAAYAAGLGASRLLGDVQPRWATIGIAITLLVAGMAMFGIALWRYNRGYTRLRHTHIPLTSLIIVSSLIGALLAVGVLGMLLIFAG